LQLRGPIDADPRHALRRRAPERPWYAYAVTLLPEAPGRWIDLGCGRGEFLALAAGRGSRGLGLDRSRTNAAAVAAESRGVLVADLARPLPFRDGALDGASLLEVIEHVLTAEALVAELARVIRPGGWLLLSTPNAVHWTYRWRTLTGHPPKQEGTHVRFFTRQTLAGLLERAGFRTNGRASFGKQALLGRLRSLRGPRVKVRYAVPGGLEALLAQHFIWRLVRVEPAVDA
jgi:SAM-dependent methyltransferase